MAKSKDYCNNEMFSCGLDEVFHEFSYIFACSHTAPLPTNVVSGLILAGYTTLFTLVSLMPSGKKEEPVAVVAVKSASTSAVPSIDDATFGDFIENEANLQKWIDSAE